MTATPDQVLGAIKNALGNPSSGPCVDYWGAIEGAVTEAMTGKPAKENRVIKAAETPEDATT